MSSFNHESEPLRDAVQWMEAKAVSMIRASRLTMENGDAAFPPQVGVGYGAFWLRDYAYMLEGAPQAFTEREMKDACRLFVGAQRADGAMVDCIKYNGAPIYQPGMGSLGENPVADGSQFTVAVAWHTFKNTGDVELVESLVDRLIAAMHAVPRNDGTRLVHIKVGSKLDRCPYGFTDTVHKQGDELFCALLFVQACRQLSELLKAVGRVAEAEAWSVEGEHVAKSIRSVFWDESLGLFRAATVQSTEPDIWGSAFCVYLGIADIEQSYAVARYFRDHHSAIVKRGQIRHLPGGTYWESCLAKPESYQNGAYWGTPSGWFVHTLDLVDGAMARQTILDIVNDYRQNGIYEWINDGVAQVENYLASIALPLAVFRRFADPTIPKTQ